MRQAINILFFRTFRIMAGCLLSAAVSGASAANYPAQPIKLIVPFSAGSAADIVCRILSKELTGMLGQPVVVHNKPGASGIIGTREVASSTPDGYTLGYANVVTLAINQSLYPSLPYDARAQLAPVALIGKVQSALVVRNGLPVQSVAELLAYAKRHPGDLSVGSAGNGSTGHLSAELFSSLEQLSIVHIPYKGVQQATQDLIGGRIDMLFDNLTSVAPHIAAGSVRALAVTSDVRAPSLPDLPTVAETVAGFKTEAWAGLVVPAGTPPAIVERLNVAVNTILENSAVRDQLAGLSFEPTTEPPQALFELAEREQRLWAEVIRVSGATSN